MRPIVPSSTASNSIVALSVSISAMTSPAFTASPSFLCHLAMLPSVMVGDKAGIKSSIGIARSRSAIEHGFDGSDDIGRLRQSQALEIGGIRQRHVFRRNALHRRVEIIESLLHDLRRDLAADAGIGP